MAGNGRQNVRSGSRKQIKALLDHQEELRKELQPEGDPSEAKIRSNNINISIIDLAVKPELEKKKSEHKSLSGSRVNKGDKEAKKEKIDSLKSEIEDRFALLNLTSLLATFTPDTRKGYLKLLKKPSTI